MRHPTGRKQSLRGFFVLSQDGDANAPANAITTNNNSVLNGSGQASAVYAGNRGTQSAANANSSKAVSQYDIACFQVSQP